MRRNTPILVKDMTGNPPVFSTTAEDFAALTRAALCRAFSRFRCPAKTLAKAADVSTGAAKAWLEGRATPQARHFLKLVAIVPELEEEVRRLTGMAEDDVTARRMVNDLVAHKLARRQRELEAE